MTADRAAIRARWENGKGVWSPSNSSEWRSEAACRGMSQTIFFPVAFDAEHCATARRICGACPVKEPCLTEALKVTENDDGIFAGTTPRQRRGMRAAASVTGRTCVVCGIKFDRTPGKGGTPPVTCSPLCAYDWRLERRRAYEAARNTTRRRNPDTRKRTHGIITTYANGCRCMACRKVANVRAKRRRLARASA